MAEINRKVLDISHHNDVTSWADVCSAGIRGIIHKATEGGTFVDRRYRTRKEAARAAGLLWGAYHFANSSNVSMQVKHFLATAGIDDQMLYALDWEDVSGGGTMTADQAKQFLELIGRDIGPNRCIVYAGNAAKERIKGKDPFFGAHRLWLAQYGPLPRPQESWDKYWLWQYTDGNVGPGPHTCPGVSGEVDNNSWPGTDEQLMAEWAGVETAPDPIPSSKTVEITISVLGVDPANVKVDVI